MRVGDQHYNWTIIALDVKRDKSNRPLALIRCQCGIEKDAYLGYLKDGLNKSCFKCRKRSTNKPKPVRLEKKCCTCKIIKTLTIEFFASYFHSKKNTQKWSTDCKVCRAAWSKEYRKTYVDYLSPTERKAYNRNWSTTRFKTNLHYKMATLLRSRMSGLFRSKKHRKSNSTLVSLGCSMAELETHLKSQFTPGMTWENYGLGGWEIDHIRPCASFDLTKEEEQRICFHHTNLQPLWAKDNRLKNSNYEGRKYYAKKTTDN